MVRPVYSTFCTTPRGGAKKKTNGERKKLKFTHFCRESAFSDKNAWKIHFFSFPHFVFSLPCFCTKRQRKNAEKAEENAWIFTFFFSPFFFFLFSLFCTVVDYTQKKNGQRNNVEKAGKMREFSLFSFPHFVFFIFPVLNSSRSHKKIEKNSAKNGEKKKNLKLRDGAKKKKWR